MSSQQLHIHEENRGDVPQADATNPSSHVISSSRDGTDVMGEPVNPLHEPDGGSADAPPPAATSHPPAPTDSPSPATHAPPISPSSESDTPANATANFPTAQKPRSLSSAPSDHPGASQPSDAQAASPSPYVQTSAVPAATGTTPMDSIMQVFNKWSKKAEDMTGNVWNHLRTGPNVADTALGRIAVGTKVMTGGGVENVYRQTFDVAPEEHLLKTFACYLSTSTGPVAGTLYISSHKLAFCSDRPLAIPASNATDSPTASATKTPSNDTSSPRQQQKQQMCYYKVMVPISQVESVNPSENTEKKPPEKYVQVKTAAGHEFWFMGFVSYEKGVKNLQESLLSKTTGPDTNTTSNVNN